MSITSYAMVITNYELRLAVLVVCQANYGVFLVSALPLKFRTKVLTTNLFTHQS
jgi:hypothetical protein